MNSIDLTEQEELLMILKELVQTIVEMRRNNSRAILAHNEEEAREWISFLEAHRDKEELRSLEEEISDRFFLKYDCQVGESSLDEKRTELIKKFIYKINELLK